MTTTAAQDTTFIKALKTWVDAETKVIVQGPTPIPVSSPVGFQGNPNVAVSAINTSGGITLTRTSGLTPAFVQVSASAITATGTSVPYEDLEYSWDFGDPNGTETFTDPVRNITINANTDQFGPEAAYCYRTAGSYPITLKIRGLSSVNGSSFTTATATQTFTVTAFNPTGADLYFDSVGGNDGNLGTIGSPKQTLTAINSALAAPANNTRINLKRGSSWIGPLGSDGNSADHIRITDYGSGAIPKIIANGTASVFTLSGGGASVAAHHSDTVVSNISFETTSGYNPSDNGTFVSVFTTGNATGTIDNLYFDHCDFKVTNDPSTAVSDVIVIESGSASTATSSNLQKTGFWGGSCTNPLNSLNIRIGMFVSSQQWFFVIGMSISGKGSDEPRDHHIYPDVRFHSLYRYIKFGAGPTRSFCINGNWDTKSGSMETAQYCCVSDCELTGTDFAQDISSGSPAFDPNNAQFKDWVTQRCSIHDITIGGTIMGQMANVLSWTFRDNKVWNCGTSGFFELNGQLGAANWNVLANVIVRYYRNKEYFPASSTASTPTHEFTAVGSSLNNKQQFTDNIIQDMRSNVVITDIDFTNQAGAPIDRNQYYFPNGGTILMQNSANGSPASGATKTFAQWQAAGFDTNGKIQNPNWPNPAIGNFG